MVIYSNTSEQVLTQGQSLTLTRISGCNCQNECSVNPIPGAKVKGKGTFVAAFSGNVSSATAALPVELSIAIDGVAIPTSRMVSTPETADVLNNVSTVTGFSGNACCIGIDVTIVNTGVNPITVAPNASLVVWRA